MQVQKVGTKKRRQIALLTRRSVLVLAIAVILCVIGMSPFYTLFSTAVGSATDVLMNRLINQLSVNNVERLLLSADHYFQQRKYAKAVTAYETLISNYSGQLNQEQLRHVYGLLGLSYAQTAQDAKKLQLYERMANFDPTYAHFLKGLAFDDQGRFDRARDEFELALKASDNGAPLDESSSRIIRETLERYSARGK